MAASVKIEESYATRRWGRGRLLQLSQRLLCRSLGHEFGAWYFDWPYDVPSMWPDDNGLEGTDMWDPVKGDVRDPRPDEELVWVRRCRAECGCLQVARAPLSLAGLLPGKRRNLYDHPIRKGTRK